MKPRVIVNCVASRYAGPNERIIEFSFPGIEGPAGGLMRLSYVNDKPVVELYRVEGCTVRTQEASQLRKLIDELALTPAGEYYRPGDHMSGKVNAAWIEAGRIMGERA